MESKGIIMLRKSPRHNLVECACILVLAASLSAPTACNAGTNVHADNHVSQAYLQRVVSCLVGDKSFQDFALKFDNLKFGDWAIAQYHIGSVIDRSYKKWIYNVVLYSNDMKRSVIGSVIRNQNGDLEVVQSGYLLMKHGGKWAVEEGSGGYRDYETVGKFVTSLSRKPFSRVRIALQSKACNTGHSG